MTAKASIHALTFIALFAFVTGCAGTLRDNEGFVHDSSYGTQQANALVTNYPLLIPFVPVGVIGNGIKASVENGRIELVGVVVSEDGTQLNDVTVHVIHSRLVTFDLNNDLPVFWEEAGDQKVNGHFAIDLLNTHTVRLEFSKDGYLTRDYQFEIVQSGGAPWDAVPASTQPVYGASPLLESKLRVVMKHAPQEAAATRPAA